MLNCINWESLLVKLYTIYLAIAFTRLKMFQGVKSFFKNIYHFDENTNFFKWNMIGFQIIGNNLLYYFSDWTFNYSSLGLSLWNNSAKYKVYQCFCVMALLNNIFFTLWNLLNNIIENNIENILANLTLSIAVISVLLRYAALVRNI